MRAIPKLYKHMGLPLPLALRLRKVSDKVGQPETAIILKAIDRELKRVEEQLEKEVIIDD
ncbi:MAG: hypothetical protein DDT42_02098 [candidate division WS2 bacterium]|uniref:Uncharacterized protein n=1 Tax=Psychracetigena formicireducens TaxID=2986056 RepID=A0A9E2F5I3_PSYF1|nr:hypothetical protein [Candidatus Psychracetigena formicireducens]